MAQTITNQASLNYQYNGQTGSALSNIATASLTAPLSSVKKSVEGVYRAGDKLTFTVGIVNSGSYDMTDITVTDNMGAYTVGTISVTPLTLVLPGLLYINGEYRGTLTPTSGEGNIVFTIPSLDTGASAVIVYEVIVGNYAPLLVGSEITNTVTIAAAGLNDPIIADNTVTVDEYADVTVTKCMTPASVVDGTSITYGFTLYNYGNIEATGVVLSDTFDPAPSNITVSVGGTVVAPANYSYIGGVLTLPTGGGYSVTLPPATITQDATTGLVTVVPSSLAITVTGIV